MDYRFQVNLSGIIDLLARHTYSSPQVFVRELLQNGADAISARTYLEPGFRGEMNITLSHEVDGPVLVFTDNGIGLTEEEIHLFLATIGQTSKRDEWFGSKNDFIGQFGIGLLSCFVVCDDVVVTTRSAKGEGKTIEWRGRADGTYAITFPTRTIEPGTVVRLSCKPGMEEYFDAEKVTRLAHHYGSLLRFPISFEHDDEQPLLINDSRPPWEEDFPDLFLEREAYLAYGQTMFQMQFFDYVPLKSAIGDVRGVAYVLPFSPSLAMKKTHRVYLKHMLLSEQTEGLLPDWAFFVKCVVNANDLTPTASREAFYEDEVLAATRASLGAQLRQYLIDLAEKSPNQLRALIQLHYLSFKALAIDDDEFFRIFMRWLPFETNQGTMTLTEYLEQHKMVRYVANVDQFRQTSAIAAAQSLCVINAGYTYDADLIEKLHDIVPGTQLSRIDADSLLLGFKFLTIDEQEDVAKFLNLANEVLEPFNCESEIRSFYPTELPALYSASAAALFQRSVGETKQVVNSFWSSVIDEMASGVQMDGAARLCFNYSNPVVYKISRMNEETLLRLSIQMLYLQAVLLSHRPLTAKETALLNEGMLGFIEWGADAFGEWVQ